MHAVNDFKKEIKHVRTVAADRSQGIHGPLTESASAMSKSRNI